VGPKSSNRSTQTVTRPMTPKRLHPRFRRRIPTSTKLSCADFGNEVKPALSKKARGATTPTASNSSRKKTFTCHLSIRRARKAHQPSTPTRGSTSQASMSRRSSSRCRKKEKLNSINLQTNTCMDRESRKKKITRGMFAAKIGLPHLRSPFSPNLPNSKGN